MKDPLSSADEYDGDAASIASRSDGGFESEDESYDISQSPNALDRQVLEDDENQQSLLGRTRSLKGAKATSTRDHESGHERRKQRTQRKTSRVKKQVRDSGSTETMYEMEGGYKDSSSRSSSESLTLANEKWNQEPMARKPFGKLVAFAAFVLMIFFVLAYGSYNASKHAIVGEMLSNGTHRFGPTTILISLDGFRADFLQRDLTPALKAFVESGVSPRYMLPSFPSLTFPNHFTLATGLYPESHGIVSNQFWDPALEEEFYYTNTSNSMQSKWWNAEPLWVTAEKRGIKTAVHMWPGSEAHIDNRDPTYLDKYNGSEALGVKVDRILQWLDLPQKDRPQFIAAYVPNVDADGHKYGPNSTEIRATIVEVDSMLTNLVAGLLERNLTEIINLVIVSDHGMATTSNERLLQLDHFIDMSLVDHIDGWPLRGLRLRHPDRDASVLHEQLLAASKKEAFDVYTRETMPERYHFSNNDRIAPIWVVPRAGWVVIEKADFDIAAARSSGTTYRPKGLHGYDHEHPLMRAIFIARGPAFPHQPNSRVPTFQNIEVYNIICDSLGIEPHPNNGTLRLPLETLGLHSENDEPDEESAFLDTAPASTSPLQTEVPATSQTSLPNSDGDNASRSTESLQMSSNVVSQSVQTSQSPAGKDKHPSTPSKSKAGWLDFLHNKLDQAKEWAKGFIDSFKKNKQSEGSDSSKG